MALIENIFSLISMRSFSSLWFWVVVAVYWSAVSRSVLGAPHDMIVRARKGDAQNLEDLHALIDITVRRKLRFTRRAGHWSLAFNAALMTVIGILAVQYGLELAQALLLLFVPMIIVRLLALRLAFRIERTNLRGPNLCRALLTHRFWVQAIGVLAIFITSIWGMLFVMSRSVLGS
ncbi:MAG: component of SufBCD complex [Rhodobacteraceae bacterium]|nr:MAG: component of SufBCD complex [Paracoccaceae bacterium]